MSPLGRIAVLATTLICTLSLAAPEASAGQRVQQLAPPFSSVNVSASQQGGATVQTCTGQANGHVSAEMIAPPGGVSQCVVGFAAIPLHISRVGGRVDVVVDVASADSVAQDGDPSSWNGARLCVEVDGPLPGTASQVGCPAIQGVGGKPTIAQVHYSWTAAARGDYTIGVGFNVRAYVPAMSLPAVHTSLDATVSAVTYTPAS